VSDVQTGTVTTNVPARLDRLLWSRWHWMIVIGLVEIFLGVRAERQSLEDIAQPLTAADAGSRPRESRAATWPKGRRGCAPPGRKDS
jgi:hypothetical protein